MFAGSRQHAVTTWSCDCRPQVLGALLPGISAHRLRQLPAGLLRQLAADVGRVCARLVELRALFPGANIVELVNRR